MTSFIDNNLCLKNADILVFAGDNSHYPKQNKLMLEMIVERKIYKKIFITFGNHDMYLVSNSLNDRYHFSKKKIEHFKQICEDIDTVEFLDGNIVEVDDVKIGGTGLFYDFSYGIKNFNLTKEKMIEKWKDIMNDSINISGLDDFGCDISFDNHGFYNKKTYYTFDPIKFFNIEKEKMLNIIKECNIFVSHIGPVVPPNIGIKHQRPETGFYFFDGEEYLMNDKAPKLWIFGHTHDNFDFKINNTHLMCNPLGYKSEGKHTEVVIVDLFNLTTY